MQELDEIIYAALNADETLASVAGGIHSTCVEVPPTEDDNTPVPYIIITDDPYTNDQGTKDDVWESGVDHVQASVIINASSPAEVKQLRRKIRHAIASYVASMESGQPYLTASSNEGIAWDWQKPCYYDTLHYQCDMDVTLTDDDNEQEE